MVSRATQCPAAKKLPERSPSPGFLAMGHASPVSRLSLAWAVPSSTTASAAICSPAWISTTSSCTNSSESSSTHCPSRRQRTLWAETRVSSSMVFLARSCWIMPMRVFQNTIPRNPMFSQEPTDSSMSASTRNTRLK